MMAARLQPSFENVASFRVLVEAARRAAQGKARSNDTARFLLDLEPQCLALRRELLAGTYAPRPYRTFAIQDPKPRIISAAAFRDRVVHHALCAEVEPALERGASPASYACRVGGGQRRALRRAQALSRQHPYVLSLDIEHFFETLSHEVLLRLLRRRIGRDVRLLALAGRFVAAGAPGSSPGRGVPIGNLTSQHFANFYLGPLDRLVGMELRLPFVRYMDDIRVFGPDRDSLWAAWVRIASFVRDRLDVALKERTTRVQPTSEGAHFLGFRVFPGHCPFDNARRSRFIRHWRRLAQADDTVREDVLQASASSLHGWADHGTTAALRRSLAVRWAEAEEVNQRGGSNRVNRGGSWNNNAQNARAGNRNNNDPGNRNNNIGFRLASTGEKVLSSAAGIGGSTEPPSAHAPRPLAD